MMLGVAIVLVCGALGLLLGTLLPLDALASIVTRSEILKSNSN